MASHGNCRKPGKIRNGAKEHKDAVSFAPFRGSASFTTHPALTRWATLFRRAPGKRPPRPVPLLPRCSSQQQSGTFRTGEGGSQLPTATEDPSTLRCRVTAGTILPEIDRLQRGRYSRLAVPSAGQTSPSANAAGTAHSRNRVPAQSPQKPAPARGKRAVKYGESYARFPFHPTWSPPAGS
jgi:hypothetical protein